MALSLLITEADCAGLIQAIDDFLAHHGHLLDTAPEEAPADVWPAAAGATT